MVVVEKHPFLRAAAFLTDFPGPLGGLPPPPAGLLAAAAPDEPVRLAVRDMLRWGGYKPTGRGKPASEYLVRAAADGALRSINLAVDACNAASLRSGLPASVVDADLARPPWRIAVAAAGARYVFNPSGQEIDLGGLLCLFDAEGPCANAVKDSQRTKTHAGTTRTLSVVWGVSGHDDLLARTVGWYRALLEDAGARTRDA